MSLVDNVRALLEIWNPETGKWDLDSEEYVNDLMEKLDANVALIDADEMFIELGDEFYEEFDDDDPEALVYSDYQDDSEDGVQY